jgi:thymidylate synthase (FAD)
MSDLIGKRIAVLDKGWIELQAVMGDDNAIVAAARASMLGESKGEESDRKLIRYLMRHNHTSPFEMGEIKLRAHAPLVVWWQWVRHRTQSYNFQSGRYTELGDGGEDFYIPARNEWRIQSKSNKQGSDDRRLDNDNGQAFSWMLEKHIASGMRMYKDALSLGVAREQARLFLAGFAVYYTAVVKCDLHNWLNFLRLRTAGDAQFEIRRYAEVIGEQFIAPAFPVCYEAWQDKQASRL